MSDLVRIDRAGVVWLELNRPASKNALTTDLLRRLREQLWAVRDDPDTRVVVLAAGGDVFCAGADLKELAPDAPPRAGLARVRLVTQVLHLLRELEQPTIAAVQVPAVGAGWGLALACDLCFVSADATFSLPEVAKGLRLPGALVHRLIEIVGPVRAAEIVLGGAVHTVDDARRLGWATRVLEDPEALTEHTWQFAAELATRPRRAVTAAKQPMRRNPVTGPTPPPEYAWNEE